MSGTHAAPAAERLIARVEAVPLSRWHVRARLVAGSATFFDAFDTLSLAFVLPVLVEQWDLSSTQVGALIAAGYLGSSSEPSSLARSPNVPGGSPAWLRPPR